MDLLTSSYISSHHEDENIFLPRDTDVKDLITTQGNIVMPKFSAEVLYLFTPKQRKPEVRLLCRSHEGAFKMHVMQMFTST